MILAAAAQIAFQAAAEPSPSAQRIGVYVTAAVFGLLVSGIISCIKEVRNELAARP
ncbi:MAG TPA: hypothetical protein VG942_05495 [Hyphomonadaceae bacterium]|nr:hypothetical protein [Hyphomonadaceae bacterium]